MALYFNGGRMPKNHVIANSLFNNVNLEKRVLLPSLQQ